MRSAKPRARASASRGRAVLLACAALAASRVAPARAQQPAPPPPHRELNIVPVVGGDSDVGVGFGEVSDWARLDPAFRPYVWRLETGAFITFKLREASQVIVPYQDYYLLLTLPDIGGARRLRLDIRPSYTDETTLRFYGIGNATPLPSGNVPIDDTEYRRVHPTLSIEARYRMFSCFFLQLGSVYTHNWLEVRPTSMLARAQAAGPPEVRELLGSFAPHGVELIEVGLQYDSRDDEIVTGHGAFHTLELRVSPRLDGWLPYQYEQLDATLRFYAEPIPRWLALAWRVVGDALLGTPPFYELARFDETPAVGGGKAVRGVPAQRYYGKVKLFENLEVRSAILPFTVGGKRLVLGLAAFLDGGRTWTELGRAHPDLDGTGWGLKYGIGGGLRLQEGQTFVVRADLAWSPDAQPIGAYFAAGEIFWGVGCAAQSTGR